MKKKWMVIIGFVCGALLTGCGKTGPVCEYELSGSKNVGKVILEKTFDDVIKQGEIEGLNYDKDRKQLLLLYNRGAKIVAGMPTGFYEGYSEELHEVFVYNLVRAQQLITIDIY